MSLKGRVTSFRIGRIRKFMSVSKLPMMMYAGSPPKIVMYSGRYVWRAHARRELRTAVSAKRTGRERCRMNNEK
jgi:hypothetical protein